VLEADQAGASFGFRVASAGDVNGDGYSDAIIGAPSWDGGQVNEGGAFVYHGGAGGLAVAPAWTTEPDQAGAQLGRSVATAGDVNGDGFSDLMVGAPYYDDGEIDEGRVLIHHGSATGLGAAVLLTQGDQPGALYGLAIGTAGDVNGDGFSEAMVGAPGYDFVQNDGGAVWVFPGNNRLGLDRVRRQMKTDLTAPIDILGRSDSQSEVLLHTLARTPAGRGRVRLEIEMKPLGFPFDGTDLVRSAYGLTGVPAVGGSAISILHEVSGLLPGTMYHWRVRIASDSPFFPRSPWLWHPGNAVSEGDIRTGGNPIGIAGGGPGGVSPASGLALGPATPNPFSPRIAPQTRFDFVVPARGRVHVAVYDLTGRLVAELSDGPVEPGKHGAEWNGRTTSGEEVPSGVYFLRLVHAGGAAAQKVVVRR
jgi:hypothetical protein